MHVFYLDTGFFCLDIFIITSAQHAAYAVLFDKSSVQQDAEEISMQRHGRIKGQRLPTPGEGGLIQRLRPTKGLRCIVKGRGRDDETDFRDQRRCRDGILGPGGNAVHTDLFIAFRPERLYCSLRVFHRRQHRVLRQAVPSGEAHQQP